MCDVCVQIFDKTESSEYLFCVDFCILCCLDHVKVLLKSSMTETRVICIDREEVCDAVALKSLTCLQKAVELKCSLQRMFNIIFETSSDMYIWENL